jgi:hypothetical protein
VELDSGGEADEARPETDREREVAQETLEALAAGISSHWMGGYENLGSVPGIIGTRSDGCQRHRNGGKHGRQNAGSVHPERTRAVDDGGLLGHSVPDNRHAKQVGPRVGTSSRKGCITGHGSKSWRSQPSRRQGRDSFHQLIKNQQREEHRTGSATPAVQRGSVPRRLFLAALQ